MIFHQYFKGETHSKNITFRQKFLWKFFQGYNLRGNDFARIKKFRPKLLIKIMDKCTLYYDFPSVFLKTHIPQKKISYKNVYENFSKVTIFEKMILQE
jgi:hypothetical protein